ncbi:MAG: septum formation protein Maf [Planctomycetes bacterium]|nr:septum formation protein Maf [Planctomycetota bacterium]
MILASSSPRRRELLSQAGVSFEVISPHLAEPVDLCGATPMQTAQALAYFKARAVWDSHRDRWVLGADTIVNEGGEVLGKPLDAEHARSMLRRLSSARHTVITGVALLGPGGRRSIMAQATGITMRRMTEQEVDQYISSGEWIGKAGAYAIQETADRFVQRVEGSFSNVVGLPMELVMNMLAREGVIA